MLAASGECGQHRTLSPRGPLRDRELWRRRTHSGWRDRTHSRRIESFDYQPHGQDHFLKTYRGHENTVHDREAEVLGEAGVDGGDQVQGASNKTQTR